MSQVEEILTEQINSVVTLESELELAKNELQLNPQFKKFLELQQTVNDQAEKVWKYVEEKMIENDVKQLKGDFGTITIAERLNWEIDQDELPAKFYKKVPDTTKISATFRLEGKSPKGAKPSYKKYLTKRLKTKE